ncbi:MAG: hypothetical protein ABR525_04250 [Candidatus Limnocylindria bacterium]
MKRGIAPSDLEAGLTPLWRRLDPAGIAYAARFLAWGAGRGHHRPGLELGGGVVLS